MAASAANAQNYTYNRVFYDGLVLKMKGTVSLTDTTLVITTENSPTSAFDIEMETNTPEYKQFWVKMPEGVSHEIRISITDPTPPLGLKKGERGVMIYQHKDLFTNVINQMAYFLIPE